MPCKNQECLHKTFQPEYTNNANIPETKEKIIEIAMNGSETRNTRRVLGISKDTITAILKKRKNSQNQSTRNI